MSRLLQFSTALLVFFSLPGETAPVTNSLLPSTCRVLPGDKSWPDASKWDKLRSAVQGRLIKTVPLATVCHGDAYDKIACDNLQQQWVYPAVHETSASSIMTPWFQNASCDPFSPQSQPCGLGNYVSYAIEVTGADDAIAGIKFAQQNNMRLVIKNTGHDYLGKSTGAGALGLWTHHMNSTQFISNYQSRYYNGPAFKFGAGIIGANAYTAAKAYNMRVVGGDCPSVGLAGGYTQGGGHSIISGQNGMGADQVLEWEVVTAHGDHLVATPEQHSDLYWALSGGGAGTYGVVISITVRVFPDERAGGATLSIPSPDATNDPTFWKIVQKWQDGLVAMTDAGITAIYAITSTGLALSPLTVPGATEDQVREVMKPFTDYMKTTNRTWDMNVTSYESYFDHIVHYFGPFPNGPWENAQSLGGKMIPRDVIEHNGDSLVDAMREAVATPPFYVSSIAMNAGNAGKDLKNVRSSKPIADNAVLPAWRDALLHVLLPGPWNFTAPRQQHVDDQKTLSDKLDKRFRDVAGPKGANYMNEANWQNADFKKDFFGVNYPRLRAIKAVYDPESLFYAPTAVGSDEWTTTSEGRLCRS